MKRTAESAVFITLQELLELKRNAKQFSLAKLKVKSHLAGELSTRLLARGMEFAESRRYNLGDDVRNIDWRVTARTGKAHTKLFTAERTRKTIFAVDMRPSMYFATKGVFKTVQASLLVANIGWSAASSGDQIGGLIFDDNGIFESRPYLKKRGLFPLMHELAKQTRLLHKKTVSDELKTDVFDQVVERLNRMKSPGSLVYLISDFRNLSPYAEKLLIQIASNCHLYLIFIYDPIEASFPKNGNYKITDGELEQLLNGYDKKSVENYRRQFLERKDAICSLSSHAHIHFMECATDEDSLIFLKNHFSLNKL